jgi:VanZ family protein
VHAAEYAVLGLLLYAALTGAAGWFRPMRALVAIALAVAAASADEWHQSFMRFRAGRTSDVAVDAFGAGLGQALAFALARTRGECAVV